MPFFQINCFATGRLCDEKSLVQARFLLGPAGSGKTFRCLAEIRAALAVTVAGRPAADFARAQTGHVPARTAVACSEWRGGRPREPKTTPSDGSPGVSPHQLSGYTRLHIFSFERLAQFVFEKLQVAPPQLLAEEGRVMVLRALLMRHERRIEVVPPQRPPAGFRPGTQPVARRTATAPIHTRQTPRPCLAAWPDSRELQDKLHDLALLLDAYARWLAEHELQDANRLLDFGHRRVALPIPQSAIRIPQFKPVARRFRRNDAAGTGFARRHLAVLRARDACVLPRKRTRNRNFLAFDLVVRRQDVSAMPATA